MKVLVFCFLALLFGSSAPIFSQNQNEIGLQITGVHGMGAQPRAEFSLLIQEGRRFDWRLIGELGVAEGAKCFLVARTRTPVQYSFGIGQKNGQTAQFFLGAEITIPAFGREWATATRLSGSLGRIPPGDLTQEIFGSRVWDIRYKSTTPIGRGWKVGIDLETESTSGLYLQWTGANGLLLDWIVLGRFRGQWSANAGIFYRFD